jgi:hypothetical protein
MFWRQRREQELADAREEALRWYERLGGQIANLSGDEPAVKQALVDAAERYNAAGSQLDRAGSVRQYQLARETALEGLTYIRAARVAMGLDPGPDLPPLAGQRGVGSITEERELEVDGSRYRASPQPAESTPYYYPGGQIQGRPVPAGWYSEPWWKTALATGAGVVGGMALFDLLAGGFDDGGAYGAYGGGDYDGAGFGGDYDGAGFGGDYGDFGGGDFGGGSF